MPAKLLPILCQLGSVRSTTARARMRIVFATLAAVVAAPAVADDALAARRAEIARLQASEQQELLRKQERFNQLPLAEQERLRKFQAMLDADEDAERLQGVLERYHEWLKTLTPSQRTRLAELEPSERVEEIRRIKKMQRIALERHQRVEVLSPSDMKEILAWTEDFVWQSKKTLMADMPKEYLQRFEKYDRKRQQRTLLLRAFERSRHEGKGGLEKLEQEDIDRLAKRLSEPAQKKLSEASSLADERRLVGMWIGTSVYRLDPWPNSRKPNPLMVEELLQHLQNDVPPPERERLLKLPREQMLDELRAMYFERRRGEPGPGRPWFDGKGSGDRGKGSGDRGKSYRGGRPGGPPKPVPDLPDAPPPDDSPASDAAASLPPPEASAPPAEANPAPTASPPVERPPATSPPE